MPEVEVKGEPIILELNEAESVKYMAVTIQYERRTISRLRQELDSERKVNADLHELLAKEQATSAEWRSKYMALFSHVSGPPSDIDTSPPGGE